MIEVLKQIQQCLKDKMYAHAEMYLSEAIAELESQESMSWHESIQNQKKFLAEMEALLVKTSTPQRTWVELEGEEIRNSWEEATKPDRSTMTMVTSFARALEAKLKEKNT
jgi:hypothetical protein